MFPLGHAAFAYLSYVGLAAATRRPLPVRWALVPLAVGSQLPDLLDKPLSFYGVLASGRSLGHSVLVAGAFVAGVWALARRLDGAGRGWRRPLERAPAAFAVGYLSHLLGDSVGALAAGRYGDLAFLLWPVLPPVEYPGDAVSPVARLLALYRTPLAHPELELILLAAGVFVALKVRERRSAAPDAR